MSRREPRPQGLHTGRQLRDVALPLAVVAASYDLPRDRTARRAKWVPARGLGLLLGVHLRHLPRFSDRYIGVI